MSRTEHFDAGHGMEHHNVSEPTFEIPKHKISEAIVDPETHNEGERAHNILVDGEPVGYVERKREEPRRVAHGKYTRGKWVWTANGADPYGSKNAYTIGKGNTRHSPSVHEGGVSSRKQAVELAFQDHKELGTPQRFKTWQEQLAEDAESGY